MQFIPGAVLDPGAHWNYEAGIMRLVVAIVWHYTVGVDSRAIGRAGYFGILISRDGTITMFGPWDAIQWHACEWNPITIGIEIESLDGSITDLQIVSLGFVTLFLLTQTGMAPSFYEGPRIDVGGDIPASVTCHEYLHERACDEHYDGFPRSVYDQAMGGTTPAPPTPEEPPMDYAFMARRPSDGAVYLCRGTIKTHLTAAAYQDCLAAPAITYKGDVSDDFLALYRDAPYDEPATVAAVTVSIDADTVAAGVTKGIKAL